MENKNIKKIAIIVIVILGLSLIGYFSFIKGDSKSEKNTFSKKGARINPSDTLNKDTTENKDVYGEEMYAIPNKTLLRSSMNSSSRVVDTLRFGAKVYIKRFGYSEEEGYVNAEALLKNEKQNGYIAVYANSPKTLDQEPIGYVNEKTLVEEYEFKKFKKYFSLKEFTAIESKNKRIILENTSINNGNYYLTQDAKRAPYTIVNGDFDGDGLMDFCVALDNVDDRDSAVLVFLTNSQTKEPYLAYTKVFDDYIKLRKMNKNEMVDYKGTVKGIEHDAVFVINDSSFNILVYDDSSNKILNYPGINDEESE